MTNPNPTALERLLDDIKKTLTELRPGVKGDELNEWSKVDRLVRIVECLKKQRDGYRENYWALCRPSKIDEAEIKEDNDAEINRIAEGGEGFYDAEKIMKEASAEYWQRWETDDGDGT